MIKLLRLSNLFRQPATPAQKDLPQGTLTWGQFDAFPLKWANLVQESPTAASCISTLTDFIEGSGFSEADLNKLVVNTRGETFAEFHHQVAENYGLYEGLAICVKYNAEATISEFYSMPFENCRLGIPDDKGNITKIYYNPYFGTKDGAQKKYLKEYDVFNPAPAIVRAQQVRDGKKYKGQIFYYATTKPLSRFYPLPDGYAAKFWMEVDHRIGNYHKEDLQNGLFQSAIMTMIGDPGAPSTHPEDFKWDEESQQNKSIRTAGERWLIELENFEGSERAGTIMMQWVSKAEEKPILEAFPVKANGDLFKTLQDMTTKNITVATKVVGTLANISEGAQLGGDGNVIRTGVRLMQQRVIKKQKALERVYSQILPKMASPYNGVIQIVSWNPFPELGAIDSNIWGALTTEEKRKWIKENTDYPILEEAAPQPALPTASTETKFKNFTFSGYPDRARDNARRAIKWHEASGASCGSPAGWRKAQMIAEDKPLAYNDLKRTYNYLYKNEGVKNQQFSESCNAVLYNAWGGNEMLEWLADKIKMVEK